MVNGAPTDHSTFAIRYMGRGEWRIANGEWGRRTDHSLFAYQRLDFPLRATQVLENAQNGKGFLLAAVGMDLGSTPRSHASRIAAALVSSI